MFDNTAQHKKLQSSDIPETYGRSYSVKIIV